MNRKRNVLAEKTEQLLKIELRKNANSTACAFFYQPKAPKELAKFRKK